MIKEINIKSKNNSLLFDKSGINIVFFNETEIKHLNAFLSIKNIIKMHRIEKNLNQSEMANKCCVDQSTISRLEKENGSQKPNNHTIVELAKILGEDFKKNILIAKSLLKKINKK